jgi:hypothetical protein
MGLSNWININHNSISNRHIKELLDFKYLEKISQNEINFIKRRNKHVSKMLMYKIKVNYKNEGEFIIQDFNICDEFEKIMVDYDTIYCNTNNLFK